MSTIKAIETRYKGHRFRSRLEARWAVFFDALGIPWHYELEGFELSNGTRYLPDFWLPTVNSRSIDSCGLHVEIKPATPHQGDLIKAATLASDTAGTVAILTGWVGSGTSRRSRFYEYSHRPVYECVMSDESMVFMQCHSCSELKYEFWLASYCVCNSCGKEASPFHPRLTRASVAAQSAQFEFGEPGAG